MGEVFRTLKPLLDGPKAKLDDEKALSDLELVQMCEATAITSLGIFHNALPDRDMVLFLKRQPHNSFPQFSRMSLDLRLIIWHLCIPRRREVFLHANSRHNQVLPPVPAPLPLFQVCRESRFEAFRSLKINPNFYALSELKFIDTQLSELFRYLGRWDIEGFKNPDLILPGHDPVTFTMSPLRITSIDLVRLHFKHAVRKSSSRTQLIDLIYVKMPGLLLEVREVEMIVDKFSDRDSLLLSIFWAALFAGFDKLAKLTLIVPAGAEWASTVRGHMKLRVCSGQ